jgi:nitroimidazol reductase NimA-like FMN-containing flavoprotein (pyridoxamine 5'-phosphate oxidase superfamily)
MKDIEFYESLLENSLYCTVSVVFDNAPWATPVYFYADRTGIYWTSARKSKHSIAAVDKCVVTLFPEGLAEGTGAECGLYLQGSAVAMTDVEEIARVKMASTEKANRLDNTRKDRSCRPAEDYLGDSLRAVYRFVPSSAWTNGLRREGNWLLDESQPFLAKLLFD